MLICASEASFYKLLKLFKGKYNYDVIQRFPVVDIIRKSCNSVNSFRLDGTRNCWNERRKHSDWDPEQVFPTTSSFTPYKGIETAASLHLVSDHASLLSCVCYWNRFTDGLCGN